jgi:serine/threonine protein kinase
MELERSYQQPVSEELAPGSILLQGQYRIESFLNSGGFGMTYLATDSLNRKVVIKECFPTIFCQRAGTSVVPRNATSPTQFRSIVRHFIREAHRLAKLDHPNIVGVHQVFEYNQTAYMALDYVAGRDLLDILEDRNHYVGPIQIKELLLTILDAVWFTHSNGLLHRDISPDNILLDQKGVPVLIDFGAARENETETGKAMSALLTVKEGYSPQEFYVAGSAQGPFSDLYALGATFYHLICGEKPPNSQDRLAAIANGAPDPYRPLSSQIIGYDSEFLSALDQSLELFPKDRIQSAQDWIGRIDPSKRKAAALARAQSDESIRETIRRLVSETQIDLNFEEMEDTALFDEAAKPSDDQAEALDENVNTARDSSTQSTMLGLIASLFFGGRNRKNITAANEVKL